MAFALLKVIALAAALLASNVIAITYCESIAEAEVQGTGTPLIKSKCDVKDPTTVNTLVTCDINDSYNQITGKSHWYPSEGHHELSLEVSTTASRPVGIRIFDLKGPVSKVYKVLPYRPACTIVQEGVGENSIHYWML